MEAAKDSNAGLDEAWVFLKRGGSVPQNFGEPLVSCCQTRKIYIFQESKNMMLVCIWYLVFRNVSESLTGGSCANKKLRQQYFGVYESGVIMKITFDIWLEVSPTQ